MEEKLVTLAAELREAVRYLSGMLEDIEAGVYTAEDAVNDHDALTGSSPLGLVFALGEFADTYDGGDE